MLVFLLLMNASGFAIMLLDKNLARRHRRRIPEALLLAFTNGFEIISGHLRQMARPVKEEK